MLNIKNLNYNVKKDIEFIMLAEEKNIDEFSNSTNVSRATIYEILETNKTIINVYEKIYSYIYNKGYRINSVKEDILKEINTNKVLFHGSKHGLDSILSSGSRESCDFGQGFYLGETYDQALSFVCESKHSSVYSFTISLENLNVINLECTIEWMLTICYYRGTLKNYENHPTIKDIIKKINNADVIIAPITDNRMYYIMTQFVQGEINADVALHSLSASKLGKQFVLKTEKSIEQLIPCEKYFLCHEEKIDCIKRQTIRALEIETKLKLTKREFRTGLYIEELLK